MLDLKSLLNEKQCEAATCPDQYLRIIAGAGSGKTRVLTYRIAYLIDQGVSPYSILAITFTNKAASEIKARVFDLLGEQGVTLCTIHSWCYRFLRREIKLIGYSSNFTILDEDDQLTLMKQIFEDMGLSKKDSRIKIVLNFISSEKTEGHQYEDIKDQDSFDPNFKICLEAFRRYTEKLKEQKSLDFDDLLLKTIEILEQFQEVKDRYSHRYTHILVDEFQDINEVQFRLIKLLLGKDTSLTVVGDPDQTIYTWRGAKNEIMLRLDKFLHRDIKTVILDRNYRSTNAILKVANALISNNKDRMKKDLYSLQPDGEKVEFVNSRTAKEEANYIATKISEMHREGLKYQNIAVLYRANYLTRELETQLAVYGIPYKVYGGLKFYQRREIKDILAYVNLLINPDSDLSLMRIINVPRRMIGEQTIDILKKEAEQNGQNLYIYLVEELKDSSVIPDSKKKSLLKMVGIIEQTREKLKNSSREEISNVFEQMMENLGYFDYLLQEDDGEDREENVKELLGALDRFLKDNEELTYVDFFNNAMLQTSQDDLIEGDYVSLMTVHIAKGLEFDYVFVYSLGEGIFPNVRAVTESKTGLEEERRLAYVAFTRARKKLYLTSNQDYSYVLQAPLRPSRFIKESGIEYRTFQRPTFENSNFEKMYFEEQKKKIRIEQKNHFDAKNNIVWKVGDRLEHNKWGSGEVVELLNGLIIVRFDDESVGKKTLIGNYFGLKKI